MDGDCNIERVEEGNLDWTIESPKLLRERKQKTNTKKKKRQVEEERIPGIYSPQPPRNKKKKGMKTLKENVA